MGICSRCYYSSNQVRRGTNKICSIIYRSTAATLNHHPQAIGWLQIPRHLKAAFHRSLKSGVNSNNKIELEFRIDVFKYLFNGKGRNPPTGRGLFYDLEDFNVNYSCDDRYVVYDKLGDGCCTFFLIRLEIKLKWSSSVFSSSCRVKPRVLKFTEIVCAPLIKNRC